MGHCRVFFLASILALGSGCSFGLDEFVSADAAAISTDSSPSNDAVTDDASMDDATENDSTADDSTAADAADDTIEPFTDAAFDDGVICPDSTQQKCNGKCFNKNDHDHCHSCSNKCKSNQDCTDVGCQKKM